MNKAGIYKIQRVGTDQCYVGSTACLRKRWTAHRRDLNSGKHHAAHLQNAWTKYGAEAFEFEVIELCGGDKETLKAILCAREQFWMDALKPSFNTVPAAMSTLGFKMPRHIVEKHRKQITGRTLSPEHAEKARTAALGKKNSLETIEKKRLAGIARGMPLSAIVNSANLRRGKPLSPEHIEKVRLNSTGRKHSPETIEKMRAANTPELRAKKSAATKGKKQTPEQIQKRIAAMVRTKLLKKQMGEGLGAEQGSS